jgi:hypothetical protein
MQCPIPTLVEVKRSTNSQIRREVVGQMLDYAANAVIFWPVEKLRATFEANCLKAGDDPEQLIADLLGEREESADSFWSRVATNLQAQRVRLIFVADQIPIELLRVIEFLNGQMSPAEVFGVEVRQYEGQGLRTLVPRIVGRSAQSETRKMSTSTPLRTDWGWDKYEEELHLPAERLAVGQEVLARVLAAITERELPWRATFRKGYIAIQRGSGWNVAIIDLMGKSPPRFAVKLPATPDDLGLRNPYPDLPEVAWDAREEWGWTIPTVAQIPDVGLALDLARPYHPLYDGSMVADPG